LGAALVVVFGTLGALEAGAFFGAGFALGFWIVTSQFDSTGLIVQNRNCQLTARIESGSVGKRTGAATGEKTSESSWTSKTESSNKESSSMIASLSTRLFTK
jgi:hypothetical protein